MALGFWNPLTEVGKMVCRFIVQTFLSAVGLTVILGFIAVILLGVDALINLML